MFEFCQEKGAMQIQSQGSRNGLVVKQRDCLDGNKGVKMSGCLLRCHLPKTDRYVHPKRVGRTRTGGDNAIVRRAPSRYLASAVTSVLPNKYSEYQV